LGHRLWVHPCRDANYPFQLRALQAPIPSDGDEPSWSRDALRALAEVRKRLDLTIERVADEE